MKRIVYTLFMVLVFTACHNGDENFDAVGVFEATEVVVSSEATGKILELNLQEGECLEANQKVGCIDTMQLFFSKKQIAANLKAVDIRIPDIQKQIAVLEQQRMIAHNEKERMQRLVEAHAGSQKSVDDWQHQIEVLQTQIVAQQSTLRKTSGSNKAQVEAMQYQLMQLNDKIQKSIICSPRYGTVLKKYVEAGEVTTIGRPLFKIADVEVLFLRAYVTGDQLNKLKLKQALSVRVDDSDGYRYYKGSVVWIADKAEFTPKGIQTKDERAELVYAIKIAVKNDGFLKIGQYGEVVFGEKE